MSNDSAKLDDALRASADSLWLRVNVLAITGIARYGSQNERRTAVRWLKDLFGGELFNPAPASAANKRRRSAAKMAAVMPARAR